MLTEFFPKLKENIVIKYINKFLYSKIYIAVIALMTLLCNIFGFELIWYYCLVAFAVIFPTLFSEDFFPVIAPLAMTYSSVSIQSNNTETGTSLFVGPVKIHLFVIFGIILFCLIGRMIYNIITKKYFPRRFPSLFVGYMILGTMFLLGGLFSPYYEFKNLLFPLVAFLSISLAYFILVFTVDWKKVKADYFMWVMSAYGLVVALEALYIVISVKLGNTVFISRLDQYFTGWGMRNNIAGQISLCVAAPVYLALKSKRPLIYLWAPIFMIVGSMLTNSRGGTLTCIVILLLALIVYFVKADKVQRIKAGAFYGVVALGFFSLYFVKNDQIKELFNRFFAFKIGETDTYTITQGRDLTWLHGIDDFYENELTGVGFFRCGDYMFDNFATTFVPRRYHNIYIQFLAATGVMGLAAYFIHRGQTLKLTFQRKTLEKTFIYFTVLALVISSLTDNHFFNIGPGLNYCIALAFIEGEELKFKYQDKENVVAN